MNITAGKYKGRKVAAPDENIVRPTLSKIRESIFNSLFSLIDFEDKSFLDMFAGSGIMGLEALSRGFKFATEIEKNVKVARIVKENYAAIGLKPDLVIGDSLKKIRNLKSSYDIIFIDPPYFSGIYEDSLKEILDNKILSQDGIIILEHVTDVNWENFPLEVLKQKKYADKKITFLKHKI